MKQLKIGIVGTRGIPNNYGGFETLVEYLVEKLAINIDVTVYCSSKDLETRLTEYRGAKLKYIPFSSHGAEGIIYDSLALLDAVRKNDKVLLLAFGGGYVIPLLKKYKNKIIVNIGGLDWKRSKWTPLEQKIIKIAEKNLIKYSHSIVSDNEGIQNYIKEEYNRSSDLIAYGGDQAKYMSITDEFKAKYPFLKSTYAFIVTRIQPDNNIELMLNSFEGQNKIPFVMVGNWNNSEYGKKIKEKYTKSNNLILLDAIYDRNILDVLRSNCKIYIHGHSAGGTNPSLVEAMYLGLPVFAYASGYNEYTTKNKAIYFADEEDLKNKILHLEAYDLDKIGQELKEVAISNYRWEIIAQKYKEVLYK